MTFRVGIGYDVHKLVPNRPLVLGGVTIPFEMGLLGHSDGDVLTHAVIDALIGALGEGDIGEFFPDTDPAYQGKSGDALMAELFARVDRNGFDIVNLDATIVAQAPKLSPYRREIRENLSAWLGIDVENINIKAKSHEGIGTLGRREGIAALAVVLIERKE